MLTGCKVTTIVWVKLFFYNHIRSYMKRNYTGYFRSCLSDEERKDFKRLALEEGSVVDVHDALLREYIGRKRRQMEKEEDKA